MESTILPETATISAVTSPAAENATEHRERHGDHPVDRPADRPAGRHPPVGAPDTGEPGAYSVFDAVRVSQVRAVATAFLRQRARIVGVGMVATLAVLAASPVARAQVLALGAGFSALYSFFAVEAHLSHRGAFSERWFYHSLLITIVGITAGSVLTGALSSPLLPIYFAPVVTMFAAFGRSRESAVALLLCATALFALAAVPSGVPFALIPVPWRSALYVMATLMALLLLYTSVSSLVRAYRHAGQVLDTMRTEVYEQAADRLRSLETVGARVAHEIKNPLSAIKALLQLEAESASAARSARRFEVMLNEVGRIERITLDYLSYARPLTELRPRPTDVGALLESLALLIGPEADKRQIALEVDPSAHRVVCDPQRVREALLNLALNAVQQTDAGGTVALRVRAAADGSARFSVTDDGRGMSAAQLQTLGTSMLSTRAGGTGLGVVLARGVARRHGGDLHFESALGRGTTARLHIPAYPGADVESGETPASAEGS